MKVQYIEKTKIAYFNGYKFVRDDKTNYYLSSGKIEGHRKRLHRYIWEYYNGEIPKGYDIHHKDHNKDNNELENLELLTSSEHKKRHAKETTEELKERYRKNLEEKARPKAIEWHKSEKSKKFHQKQYKRSLGLIKPQEYKCEICGTIYKAIPKKTNRFCSNKCKAKWRRESGIDNIERKCEVCGEPFVCNKYSKITKCYNCIPDRYKQRRKEFEDKM